MIHKIVQSLSKDCNQSTRCMQTLQAATNLLSDFLQTLIT